MAHTCPLTKLSGPHYPVLPSALPLFLSEMILCISLPSVFSLPTHIPLHLSIPLDNETTEHSGLISLVRGGGPYMFSGFWVIQLTPLLTGVSAVPTVLRVL